MTTNITNQHNRYRKANNNYVNMAAAQLAMSNAKHTQRLLHM